MKYFSTFSGVEGIGQGLDGEPVGFSEIDKYASMVLKYHFPDVKNYGDISKIDWSQVPDFDILTGGSPCQDFSIAGKRKGLRGSRSSLAWEFIRCLREKRPRNFIWENVEGVLSSRSGWDFANLLCAFSESGYDLWWQVLNAKDFGVAQSRSRIIIVGFREGSPREVFFEAKNTGKDIDCFAYDISGKGYNSQQDRCYFMGGVAPTIPSTRTENKLNVFVDLNLEKPELTENTRTIQARYYKGWSSRYGENSGVLCRAVLTPDRIKKRQNGRRFKENGEPMFTLTGQDIHGVLIPEATKQGYAKAEEGDSINLSVLNSTTRRGWVGKGVAQTLDTGMQQYTLQNARIRRLTPKECERLMSWPDDWTRWGINEKGEKIEISDSQRYKMCGNGVVSNVIKAIARELLPQPKINQ